MVAKEAQLLRRVTVHVRFSETKRRCHIYLITHRWTALTGITIWFTCGGVLLKTSIGPRTNPSFTEARVPVCNKGKHDAVIRASGLRGLPPPTSLTADNVLQQANRCLIGHGPGGVPGSRGSGALTHLFVTQVRGN